MNWREELVRLQNLVTEETGKPQVSTTKLVVYTFMLLTDLFLYLLIKNGD